MERKDFYIGQKIKLPQDAYDYHLECCGQVLEEYAEVTSLHETLDIVHYKIDIKGGFGGRLHSGIKFAQAKEYK